MLCAKVIPVPLVMDRGLIHDMKQTWTLWQKILARDRPTVLSGHGAFDGEAWHRANWEDWNVSGFAPVTVQSHDGRVGGFSRKAFSPTRPFEHGRRWMRESVNSAMMRTMGNTLRSRTTHALSSPRPLTVADRAITRLGGCRSAQP